MPTTHVQPSSEAQLQDIANSLFKARKVVVITGAGISTNSGIPDFRSENGLYSLIQAQYEAADKQTSEVDDSTTDEADASQEIEGRAPKRCRVSRDGISQKNRREEAVAQNELGYGSPWAAEKETTTDASLTRVEEEAPLPRTEPQDSGNGYLSEITQTESAISVHHINDGGESIRKEGSEHAPGPPGELPGPANAGDTTLETDINKEQGEGPLMRETCDLANIEDFTSEGIGREVLAEEPTRESSPLSSLASPAFSSTYEEREDGFTNRLSRCDQLRLESLPRSLMFRQSLGLTNSGQTTPQSLPSSPLSSPPGILVDPFQDFSCEQSSLSSRPSSRGGDSIGPHSGEPSSVSTPLLTSQSSSGSASGRTSLPNIKGKDLFDAQIWKDEVSTSVFYTFATTLRQKARDVDPTDCHRFMTALRDRRKLVRCYTQNIDQLEERVGLATSLDLGTGTRYRFSTRAGRKSGIGRSSLKDPENSFPVSQGDSQDMGESQGRTDGQKLDVSSRPLNPGDDKHDFPKAGSTSQNPTSRVATVPIDNEGECNDEVDDKPTASPDAENPVLNQPDEAPPPNRGVECVFLHGSLAQLRCFQCEKTSSWDEADRELHTMAGRSPPCPHCIGATAAREEKGKRALRVGTLRPDIVLYGEEHPQAQTIGSLIQHDLSLGPDMLLIMGTSLRVHSLKKIVKEFAKVVHSRSGTVVFVNFTKPSESVWADFIDYWVQWDCDAWVGDLQGRKPRLWLPLGMGEDDESHWVRASRRDCDGDPPAHKDLGEVAKRQREGVKASQKRKKPESDSTGLGEEGALSPKKTRTNGISSARSGNGTISKKNNSGMEKTGKQSSRKLAPTERVSVEQKSRHEAKRPQAIRDHKRNGAYLSWSMVHNLRIISGNVPIVPDRSSPSNRHSPLALAANATSGAPSGASSRPRKKLPATALTPSVTQAMAPENALETLQEAVPVHPEAYSPVLKRPKVKVIRTRKSAPAGSPLQGKQGHVKTGSAATPAEPAQTEVFPAVTEPAEVQQKVDYSIMAAVKGRSRKRTAWMMINGVETRVSLDANQDASVASRLSPPPEVNQTKATKVTKAAKCPKTEHETPHKPTRKPAGKKTSKVSSRAEAASSITALHIPSAGIILPPPTPSASSPPDRWRGPQVGQRHPWSASYFVPAELYPPRPSRSGHSRKSSGGSSGFGDTDRLIAAVRELSRPTTPQLQTRRGPNGHNQQPWENQYCGHRGPGPCAIRPQTPIDLPPLTTSLPSPPRLQPLEPPVVSPGPVASLSSDVGSPMAMPSRNPFFMQDPLARQLVYPTTQHPHNEWAVPAPPPDLAPRADAVDARVSGRNSWQVQTQSQVEHEAALTLSSLWGAVP